MFALIGITVSYQYEDYLRYCLSNATQLDHWYVVVQATDTPTIELLREIPNVTLVYFDFRAGGSIFNKSGAIRCAQELAHVAHPDAWMLLVDSDIVLPSDLRETLEHSQLDPQFLYGSYRAFYPTPEHLRADQPTRVKHRGCWGYFHLYHDKTKWCAERSKDATRYDEAFKKLFGLNRIHVLPITVKHLGEEACNWKGRKSCRFQD